MVSTKQIAIFSMLIFVSFALAQVPGTLPIQSEKDTPSLKTDEGSNISIITRFVDPPEIGKPCVMEITLKNSGNNPVEELVLSQEWKTKPVILEVSPKPFIQENKWTWEIAELQHPKTKKP
jgi:hypothetical protein